MKENIMTVVMLSVIVVICMLYFVCVILSLIEVRIGIKNIRIVI